MDAVRFKTQPYTCSYLPVETASLEYRIAADVTELEYGELLRRGWRRFGCDFFRPACPHCVKCRSLRIDVERFKPAKRPPKFRAIFSGALIKRKGIQHVLKAWHRLDLRDAELWLVGTVHDEAKPYLKKFWRDNIRVLGFVRDPETYLGQSSVHVFPSQWEGSAKVTYEAAACALPQITTREAGDVVRDQIEGIIVRPGDVEAIAAALKHFYLHPEIVEQMGRAARQRVVENFTWDHFRSRLLNAYEVTMGKVA